jgi:LysR family transcriptional activator of nhaA
LYYFWVVAKSGSIRNASSRLQLASPTVSRQLRDLELKLGVPLLERGSQSVRLTSEGGYVFGICEELFGLARELVDGIGGDQRVKPMRLTVGIAGVIPKLVIYKVLAPALHLREPVQIVCLEGAPSKMIADLANHNVDLVLTDAPLGPYSNVRCDSHLIADCPIVVCGEKSMAAQYKKAFPNSLHGAPVLLPTSNSTLRGSLDQFFFERGIVPNVRGEFEDSTIIKVFGEAGLGLFFIPAVIQREVESRFGCEVVGTLDTVHAKFFAVAPHRRIHNPATMAIIESAARSLLKTEY